MRSLAERAYSLGRALRQGHGYPVRARAGTACASAKPDRMLLRHRSPEIDTAPATPAAGLEHLQPRWITVLRWLGTSRIDYVLVGPVARAIQGDLSGQGSVGIVHAPHPRN